MKGGKRGQTHHHWLTSQEKLNSSSSAPPLFLLTYYLHLSSQSLPSHRKEEENISLPRLRLEFQAPSPPHLQCLGVSQEQCYRICTACQDAKSLRGFWWTSNDP